MAVMKLHNLPYISLRKRWRREKIGGNMYLLRQFKNAIMKKLLLLVILAGSFACKQQASQADIEKRLRESMQKHLETSKEASIANAKYEIKEVAFYPGKEAYECEFTIHMKTDTKDTTGVMKAKVSYDFATVTRRL